ncbi:MAG: hypothetical protein GY832_10395 [Chloroflexi bacterium]|nr:hypothetical protein [Chloroflexota bacterium]
MNKLVKRGIPSALAVSLFSFTLIGYLFPEHPILIDFRNNLVKGAVIIAAFAFLLGIFNILRVHGNQVVYRQEGWFYSIMLLLVTMVAMIPSLLQLVAKIIEKFPNLGAKIPLETLDALDNTTSFMFNHIIRPSEASLAALMVFTLALAAFRLLRARPNPTTVLFLAVVVIVLLGTTPFVGLEKLANVRDWIVNVPGMAGMRGLLLGVALGTVITALRVFLTIDRPYSES